MGWSANSRLIKEIIETFKEIMLKQTKTVFRKSMSHKLLRENFGERNVYKV